MNALISTIVSQNEEQFRENKGFHLRNLENTVFVRKNSCYRVILIVGRLGEVKSYWIR